MGEQEIRPEEKLSVSDHLCRVILSNKWAPLWQKRTEFQKHHYFEFTNKKYNLANQVNIHEIMRGSLLVVLNRTLSMGNKGPAWGHICGSALLALPTVVCSQLF